MVLQRDSVLVMTSPGLDRQAGWETEAARDRAKERDVFPQKLWFVFCAVFVLGAVPEKNKERPSW